MQNLFPEFNNLQKSGVIHVMERATELGFKYGNPDWANLGQGAPELGMIPNSLPRIELIKLKDLHHGYAPVPGMPELREKIANLYNDLFRIEYNEKFTAKNVLVGAGGRLVVSRIIGSLGKINLGFVTPDYTSYQGIMTVFNNVTPIPIELKAENNFALDLEELEDKIKTHNIKALLLSNPSNPTGQVIYGEQLKKLVQLAKQLHFTLIIDEFYFNYFYAENENSYPTISAATYLEDIENDPVIIISGISKAWRYPGWRLCWTIGPSKLIANIGNLASFLDGGASHPLQVAVLPIIEKNAFLQETSAIHKLYKFKRDLMLNKLHDLGLIVKSQPLGAFYIWVNLDNLKNLHDGVAFFEAGLKEKVITVPGVFFDINPERQPNEKLFKNYIRLSFGPSIETIEKGLNSLAKIISERS